MPYLLLVQPLIASDAQYRDAIAQSTEMLSRYRDLTGRRIQIEAEIAEIKRRQSVEVGFLEGTNAAIVAANLQNRIKILVESVGGTLASTQALPVREDSKLQHIGVRVQMSARLESIWKTLYTLESGTPALFVDNLEIKARPMQRPHAAASEDVALDVRLDVLGYMRGSPQ